MAAVFYRQIYFDSGLKRVLGDFLAQIFKTFIMKQAWSRETSNYLCPCLELDASNFILFPPAVQRRNLYFLSVQQIIVWLE
jgi:hypothetical protein